MIHYADILWAVIRHYLTCANFIPKGYSSQVSKIFETNFLSWVISGTSSSKLSCNHRHPSRNISCNHPHHLVQPSWRRIFSTSNDQKNRVDSDINSDYKASSFDRLYIWHRKWDAVGFDRTQQRKYSYVWGAVCFRSSWERAVTDVRDVPPEWTFETNGMDSSRRLFQKSVRAGLGGFWHKRHGFFTPIVSEVCQSGPWTACWGELLKQTAPHNAAAQCWTGYELWCGQAQNGVKCDF